MKESHVYLPCSGLPWALTSSRRERILGKGSNVNARDSRSEAKTVDISLSWFAVNFESRRDS